MQDVQTTQPDDDYPANPNAGTSRAAVDPTIDLGADPDDTRSRYEEGVGFGQALFDANNVLNRANRYLFLWNVRHRWNKASRFIFNRYCHWNMCFLRDKPGGNKFVIISKEGTLQGEVFGATIYGV